MWKQLFLGCFNTQKKTLICIFQPSVIKFELSKPDEKWFESKTLWETEGYYVAKSIPITILIKGYSYTSGNFAIFLVLMLTAHLRGKSVIYSSQVGKE